MASDLLDKIRKRGHWRFILRPKLFDAKRLAYDHLYGIISNSAVDLAGWQVPPVNPPVATVNGQDWIEQHIDWEQNKEVWRFYQSGQLVHYAGFPSDWLDESTVRQPTADWVHGKELLVPDVLFRLTGAAELAARLALSSAGDVAMHLAVAAYHLRGRVLTINSGRFAPFRYPRVAQIDEYEVDYEYPAPDLAGKTRGLALDIATEFFARFDWNPPREILQKHQEDACRF